MEFQLTDAGDLAWPLRPVSSLARAVRQRAFLALNTWRGEYLDDVEAGVPWLDWLQARPFPSDVVADFIRAEVEAVDGIASVESVDVTASADGTTVSVAVAGIVTEEGADAATVELVFDDTDPTGRVAFFAGGV